jgi:hypothetical protein
VAGKGLHSRRDFIAVKLYAHTQRAVRRTNTPYMNDVTYTNPVGCGQVGDFLWQLEE